MQRSTVSSIYVDKALSLLRENSDIDPENIEHVLHYVGGHDEVPLYDGQNFTVDHNPLKRVYEALATMGKAFTTPDDENSALGGSVAEEEDPTDVASPAKKKKKADEPIEVSEETKEEMKANLSRLTNLIREDSAYYKAEGKSSRSLLRLDPKKEKWYKEMNHMFSVLLLNPLPYSKIAKDCGDIGVEDPHCMVFRLDIKNAIKDIQEVEDILAGTKYLYVSMVHNKAIYYPPKRTACMRIDNQWIFILAIWEGFPENVIDEDIAVEDLNDGISAMKLKMKHTVHDLYKIGMVPDIEDEASPEAFRVAINRSSQLKILGVKKGDVKEDIEARLRSD